MTAKEKLRHAIEELSELEAEEARAFLARRRDRDPVLDFFENAPKGDEPLTPEEAASLDDAWTEYKRGETVPLEEFMREFD